MSFLYSQCECLQDFFKWRDPDSNRGHHDFQSYAKAPRYAENPRRYADFRPLSTVRYHLVLPLLLTWLSHFERHPQQDAHIRSPSFAPLPN
jgi:hypothetical protein